MFKNKMNLGKVVAIAICLAGMTIFSGCDNEDNPSAISVADKSSLTQEVFADNEQGKSGVTFTTTGAWTSSISTSPGAKSALKEATSSSPDWIWISPESGDAGTHTIAITLETNTTGADRTAFITVSCEGGEIEISVLQKATMKDGTIPNNEVGVVICGVRWATRNVGAFRKFVNSPEDFGCYFQWNNPTARNSTNPIPGWDNTEVKSGAIWETKNDPCPPGWRLPTAEELLSLMSFCAQQEMTVYNNVYGRLITDTTTDKCIFLPAAGYQTGNGIVGKGEADNSCYWNSTHSTFTYNLSRPTKCTCTTIYGIFMPCSVHNWRNLTLIPSTAPNNGFAIRCVAK